MKKRLLSLALALALLWGMALPAMAAADSGYSDVPAKHWAAESIRRATELGLFQGVEPGRFGLGQTMTRAQFVTALIRLFGWETVKPDKASFSDVSPRRWCYAAVETALANGAIAATGSSFRPNDSITRDEMAAMLVRGLGYTSLAGRVESYDTPFTDVTANRGYITMAHDLGIFNGVSKTEFNPEGLAKREAAAVVLVRVYDRLHADSLQISSAGDWLRITVPTPEAQAGTDMPITPLEPMMDLYDALRTLKNQGQDMDRTVLCLTGGGVRTIISDGKILSSSPVTAAEVEAVLRSDVNTYYNTQYESAYCIYNPNAYQTVTIWYQSNRSLAAKLQLARLFGVTRYLLV